MNKRSDTDRVLRNWLSDGPATMPDRVVEVVADRISRQPQRRTWRLDRRLTMTPAFKFGIAAAAVLVVAVVGYNLLPRTGSIGGPAPTATQAPSSAPTAAATVAPTKAAVTCDDQGPDCVGPLTAGQHQSTAFSPALTYTVPTGWANWLDLARFYTLHYNFAPAHTFQVISQVAIPDQAAGCTATLKEGAGNTVADWVTFLTKHPGLDASVPVPVTIGGYQGMRVTVSVAASWTNRCPNSIGPAVITMTAASADGWLQMLDDQHDTLTILDVAGQTVIIMVESGPEAGVLDTLNTTFNPVIDTFRFAPGS